MTAIVSNINNGGGIVIDSKVNVALSPNQSWTVPAGKYAEVQIWTHNSSMYFEIDSHSINPEYTYSQGGNAGNTTGFKLGPGQTITARTVSSSSTINIKGVLFANG